MQYTLSSVQMHGKDHPSDLSSLMSQNGNGNLYSSLRSYKRITVSIRGLSVGEPVMGKIWYCMVTTFFLLLKI